MKFFQIQRTGSQAVAVFVDDAGKVGKKTFSLKMTDAQIKAAVTGEKIPEKKEAPAPENKSAPVSAPAPATDDKAALRAHYLEFLKDKGIDLATERSFRKIEEAYKENGGK